MKDKVLWFSIVVFGLMFVVLAFAFADRKQEGTDGENLSPYFMVESDSDVEQFPLLKTETKVLISGMSSEIELNQVYKNNGKKTIEAIYVFPLGTRSAIHAMKMKIGERIIEARIEETQKAREIYEQAKNAGKTASLLEQKRPNVFQMNVANIMPGDIVEVFVKYSEILVPEEGTYSFVFPTVAGPRYTGESSANELEGKDNWAVNPYLKEGEEAPYDFNITVSIKTGIPIAKVWSTSHKLDIEYQGKNSSVVTLSKEDKKGGNRDFILKYNLQGNAIESGLLLYPGEKENYFLLMMEPPKNVNMSMVPPREYVFIVDVSGSMHGFPLNVSKELIGNILNGLREDDYFNIMFFSAGSQVLSDKPLKATLWNKTKALNMLSSMQGSGGTQILDALQKALSLEKKEGLSRIIIAATDGYVSVEKKAFDIVSNNLGEANFFAFGIGTSVNRYIIDGLARAGKGDPFIITNQEEAKTTADKFLKYVQYPLLTDIQVNYDGFEAYDVEPVALPDLFAQRPLVLYGKYKHPKGKIIVSGNTAYGKYKKSIEISKGLENNENISLMYLWAREKIARLADYARSGEDTKAQVTELGLKYHLMTEFTSFVAVDSEKRNIKNFITVKQPLPLPDGVSNLAVTKCAVANSPQDSACSPLNYEYLQSKTDKDYSKGLSREAKEEIAIVKNISLVFGKLPNFITLFEMEKVYLKQIENELKKYFDKHSITKLDVNLRIEKGKITNVEIKKCDGKNYESNKLEQVFKKLKLNSKVTGTAKLELMYN